jgi:hypothetical protein
VRFFWSSGISTGCGKGRLVALSDDTELERFYELGTMQ